MAHSRTNSESIEQLRARLPEALAEVHDVTLVVAGIIPNPARDPKHGFAFPSGVFLVISRDLIGTKIYTHVSASHRNKPESSAELLQDIRKACADLGLEFRPNFPPHHTSNGIPHWFWDAKGNPPSCLTGRGFIGA